MSKETEDPPSATKKTGPLSEVKHKTQLPPLPLGPVTERDQTGCLDFLRLIGEIASDIARLRVCEIDSGIDRALSRIAGLTGADRAYVFQFRDCGKLIDNTHAWSREGVEPQIYELGGILLHEELPWFTECISARETLRISDVATLPPEAQLEREHFKSQGICSLIVVPMEHDGRLIGFLGFDSVRGCRDWTEEDAAILRIICATIAHALGRTIGDRELRTSRERLAVATQAGGIGVWDLNLVNDELMWDRKMFDLYGVHPDAFGGALEAWRRGLHPDDLERVIHEFDQAVQGETSFDTEFRVICPNGERRHLRAHANVSRGEDGAALRMIGINYDITEQKQAENALIKSKSLLTEAERLAGLGSWEWDVPRDVAYWSEGLFNIFKRDPQKGAPNWVEHPSLYVDEDFIQYKNIIEECLINGGAFEFELRSICSDDEIKHCIARGRAEQNIDQKITRLWGTLQDITDRKKVDEKLQKANARHSSMIANIGDVIAIIRADGIVTYKSPNIEKWFGWKPEDLVDAPAWSTVHPDDLRRIQKAFSSLLKKENASKTLEYRYKCKDGTYTWIQLTAVNRISDPAINGVLLNYHDITERKKAEQLVRERAADLETANRRLRDSESELRFLSARLLSSLEEQMHRIALELHDEFGQCLVGLNLSLHWLAKEMKGRANGEKTAEIVDHCLAIVDRVMGQVRSLVSILRPEVLDAEGVEKALQWLGEQYQDAKPSVCTQVDLAPWVVPQELRMPIFRIAQEAINNAVKHSDADVVKVFLTEVNNTGIELVVQDNGRGFDLSPDSPSGSATYCFGLASMRERAQLSGGTLNITTAPGQGTRICAHWAVAAHPQKTR